MWQGDFGAAFSAYKISLDAGFVLAELINKGSSAPAVAAAQQSAAD